jgi:Flp pilus assembly protein TadD
MRHAAMYLGLALSGISSLSAQKTGLPSMGAGSASGSNTGSVSGPPPQSSQSSNPGMSPETQMPVFISGRVMMEDGTPPPTSIAIQRTCSGSPRTVAYTNSKGQFNFQWGDIIGIVPDASEPMAPFGGTLMSNSGNGTSGMGQDARGGPNMLGCDLTANAPGFRSGRIDLSGHRASDNPELGTITLHRMTEVEGTSVSATALNAPKDARKAWEKGSQFMRARPKPHLADAEKEFSKAVELYPSYANAWSDLGRVRLQLGATEAAREAFRKALDADGKLVEPYVQLGEQAAREQNWTEAGRNMDKALQLDPVDYPQLWFEDAVANYNLHNYERAEKNTRAALQLSRIDPRANQLLGLILINKRDYAGAKEALRAYVKMLPNAQDLDHVKAQLVEIDSRLAEAPR